MGVAWLTITLFIALYDVTIGQSNSSGGYLASSQDFHSTYLTMISMLQSQVQTLESENSHITSRLSQLETENANLTSIIENRFNQSQNLQMEKEDLELRISSLEVVNANLWTLLETLTTRFNNLELINENITLLLAEKENESDWLLSEKLRMTSEIHELVQENANLTVLNQECNILERLGFNYVENVRDSNRIIESRLDNQEREIENMRTEMSQLFLNINDLEIERDNLTSELSAIELGFEQRMGNWSSSIGDRFGTVWNQLNGSDYFVSFTAHTGSASSDLISVSENNRILFSVVTHNTQNAYDPTTGLFTCPIEGIYFITVSITPHAAAGHYSDVWVKLKRDNSVIGMINFGNSFYKRKTRSYNVISECEAGERMYVKSGFDGSLSSEQSLNCFSAFLIKPF